VRDLLFAVATLATAPLWLPRAGDDSDFERVVRPFLEAHCTICHSGDKPKAKLDLARFDTAAAARAEPATWAEIRDRVGFEEMPPPTNPQPADAERDAFLEWVEAEFGGLGAGFEPGDPGPAPLRRLNRTQYCNAVRDLVGVQFPVEDWFPPESVTQGFDHIADALTLPDDLLDKYLGAAERIAAEAIVIEDADVPRVRRMGVDVLDGQVSGSVMSMSTASQVAAVHQFPRAGLYRIVVRAFGSQAGPEVCKMAIRLGSDAVGIFEVPAVRGEPGEYAAEVRADAGGKVVAAAFLNDYYAPEAPDPADRDRNLYVEWIEVHGPLDAPPRTAFQRWLEVNYPPPDGRKRRRAALQGLAEQAWRRPVTNAELARLERLAPEKAGFEASIQHALVGILASPHFLLRIEADPAGLEAGSVRALDDWELAGRLSFFLWSSAPDRVLRERAARGELTGTAELLEEATRMLAHPQARALADDFAAQWLQLRSLDKAAPDPELFPGFDEPLREAMAQETLHLFESVMREDSSVWEILDADYTYLDERLARHYGIEGVEGPTFRKVSLAGSGRQGVLTHAGVLTLTSHAMRTSPVKRGKWVMEALLNAPPPPPPPGVDSLDESTAQASGLTFRQKLERHRDAPACAVCHQALDPLGFGLEHYDPIGVWREAVDGGPVDASGELPGGVRFEGVQELIQVLERDDAFLRGLVERLYVYALGRGIERSDRPFLQEILAGLDPEKPSVRQIVLGIVRTAAFRTRRVGG